jgi:hypothetical protein
MRRTAWPALLLAAISGQAAAAPAVRGPGELLQVGGFIGYEADDVSGLALRVDGALPFRDLGPQVKMSWVGSLGYSHLTESRPPFSAFSSELVKLVPAARFTFPVDPKVDVVADVGLGLAFVWAKLESNIPFFGNLESTSSSRNLMMRFAAGAWLKLGPQLALGAMLELDPIFGDYGGSLGGRSQTTFSILAGAAYRL